MNIRIITGFLLLSVIVQAGCAADRSTYASAAELREAAKPLLVPAPASKDQNADRGKRDREFMVEYLGSKDPELQNAAADILAQNMLCFQPIRGSLFVPYLGAEFPANVRIVALAYSLWGKTGQSEHRPQTDERFDTMKEMWGQVLNSLAQQEGLSDASWSALIISQDSAGEPGQVLGLLTDGNKPFVADRLALLIKGTDGSRMLSGVMSSLNYLGLDVAVPSLVKWYKQESDPSARLAALNHLGLLNGSRLTHQERQAQLLPLLQLATADADPEIAAKAKELMK